MLSDEIERPQRYSHLQLFSFLLITIYFTMTLFLHNLYFFVTMSLSGRHRFALKPKGGPKNEII